MKQPYVGKTQGKKCFLRCWTLRKYKELSMKNRTVPAKFSNAPSMASWKHLGHITGRQNSYRPVFSKN